MTTRFLSLAAMLTVAASLDGAPQHPAYRVLQPAQVRLTKLVPSGWHIAVTSPQAYEVDLRSLVAGRIVSFHKLYVTGDTLVGVGQAGGGTAAIVWDLGNRCQAAGFMGFDITPSADGRYLAFEQYESAGYPLTGSVVRVVDVSSLTCLPGELESGDDYASYIGVGTIVLPQGARGSKPDSGWQTQSPHTWLDESLVFVALDRAANRLMLHRYDPASKRLATGVVDWTAIVKGGKGNAAATAPSTVTFASLALAPGNGAPVVRLRVADDFAHGAKWVDVPLPDFAAR